MGHRSCTILSYHENVHGNVSVRCLCLQVEYKTHLSSPLCHTIIRYYYDLSAFVHLFAGHPQSSKAFLKKVEKSLSTIAKWSLHSFPTALLTISLFYFVPPKQSLIGLFLLLPYVIMRFNTYMNKLILFANIMIKIEKLLLE